MKRVFVPKFAFSDTVLSLSSAQLHHIKDVLRLKPTDTLEVVVAQKDIFRVRIQTFHADGIGVDQVEKITVPSPTCLMTLCQGMPKQDKFGDIVDMCTQVGVADFVPVMMTHCVVKYTAQDFEKKKIRWEKKCESAAEQASRATIPTVFALHSIDMLCQPAFMSRFDACVFGWEGAFEQRIWECVSQGAKTVAILIGPEGGFSQAEVDRLLGAGWGCFTLGPSILRTELAGVVAVSQLSARLS